MRHIALVIVVGLFAFTAGWLVNFGSVSAQADPGPGPEQDRNYHYAIYGPTGADSGWTAYSRVHEPVILLNQCTGTSWQFKWNEDSQQTGQWESVSVVRNR